MYTLLPATVAAFHRSPNRGGSFAHGLPDTIVLHYTERDSVASAVHILCDPASATSAHVVVGRDGSVTQLVEFDRIAWHAGVSCDGERSGLNRYSLGIELDNAGRLLMKASGELSASFGNTIARADAMLAVHRNETAASWWHCYTQEQMTCVFELMQLLIAHLPIRRILGHEEIAAGRKCDPGPAFPLDRLRAQLLGNRGTRRSSSAVM